jgi:hypothetical protein
MIYGLAQKWSRIAQVRTAAAGAFIDADVYFIKNELICTHIASVGDGLIAW